MAGVLRVVSASNIGMLLFVLLLPLFFANTAEAGNLQQVYIRLDRLAASTATGGTVCAKPQTAGTEADVKVTFPTGFTVNGTASNWTVTTPIFPPERPHGWA